MPKMKTAQQTPAENFAQRIVDLATDEGIRPADFAVACCDAAVAVIGSCYWQEGLTRDLCAVTLGKMHERMLARLQHEWGYYLIRRDGKLN